jgi:hypothetical protein
VFLTALDSRGTAVTVEREARTAREPARAKEATIVQRRRVEKERGTRKREGKKPSTRESRRNDGVLLVLLILFNVLLSVD